MVRRCRESRNVVSNVLPFHIICEWGVKPLPSTIRGTEFASSGMLLGESAATWAWSWPTPSQLSNHALQVQPDNNRVRAAMKAIEGKSLQRRTKEEHILASLTYAANILHPKRRHQPGRGGSGASQRVGCAYDERPASGRVSEMKLGRRFGRPLLKKSARSGAPCFLLCQHLSAEHCTYNRGTAVSGPVWERGHESGSRPCRPAPRPQPARGSRRGGPENSAQRSEQGSAQRM